MNQNDIDPDPATETPTESQGVADERADDAEVTGDTTESARSDDEQTSDAESTGDVPVAAAAAAAEAPSTDGAATIRPVSQGDFFAWYGLFAEYADFYNETLTDDRAMRAWAWLHSDEFQVRGLVAVDNASGDVVGIAHVRPFERPLEGGMGLYLDDLFVRADVRGKGFGRALIESVSAQAKEGGYGVVRWITAEDNATARKLYDSVAEKTPWVTYDITVG